MKITLFQEFFSKKTDCSLFLFGSHNKKRPNNLIFGESGRLTCKHQLMCHFHIFRCGVSDSVCHSLHGCTCQSSSLSHSSTQQSLAWCGSLIGAPLTSKLTVADALYGTLLMFLWWSAHGSVHFCHLVVVVMCHYQLLVKIAPYQDNGLIKYSIT